MTNSRATERCNALPQAPDAPQKRKRQIRVCCSERSHTNFAPVHVFLEINNNNEQQKPQRSEDTISRCQRMKCTNSARQNKQTNNKNKTKKQTKQQQHHQHKQQFPTDSCAGLQTSIKK